MTSGLRPHLRRGLMHTILAIEAQAAAPYIEALRDIDELLASLVAMDATAMWEEASRTGLVERAGAAHRQARSLLDATYSAPDSSAGSEAG